jgi:hypothetical protein
MDEEAMRKWIEERRAEEFKAMPKWAQHLGLRPVVTGPEDREVTEWIEKHLESFNAMLLTGPEIADEVARMLGYFVWGGKLMYVHFILERNLRGIPQVQLEAMREKANELRIAREAENAGAFREWREKVRKARR